MGNSVILIDVIVFICMAKSIYYYNCMSKSKNTIDHPNQSSLVTKNLKT